MADDPVIELEIRPDGSVRFEVSGVAGEGCEELEALLLSALRGEVTARERTREWYARPRAGLDARQRSRLKR